MSPATIFTVPLASSDQGRPWDVPGKRAGRYRRRSRRRLDVFNEILVSVVGGLFHVDPDSRHVPGCLSLAKPHRDKAITLPSRVSKVDPLGLRARPAPRRPTVRFPGEPPLRTASGPEATYSTRNSISIKKTITPSKRSASCDYPRSVAEIPRSTSSTDKKFVALSLPSRS